MVKGFATYASIPPFHPARSAFCHQTLHPFFIVVVLQSSPECFPWLSLHLCCDSVILLICTVPSGVDTLPVSFISPAAGVSSGCASFVCFFFFPPIALPYAVAGINTSVWCAFSLSLSSVGVSSGVLLTGRICALGAPVSVQALFIITSAASFLSVSNYPYKYKTTVFSSSILSSLNSTIV